MSRSAGELLSTDFAYVRSSESSTDGNASGNATTFFSTASAADGGGGGNTQKAIESLYPALVQTFLCIFLGYAAGRLKLISAEQAAGVGTYVSKFALPALLFQNMATLDWSTVEWRFLAAVGLSKLSVYLAVLTVGLLVTRPLNLAASAICAIFVSQSNDFALGYPIVKAMYGERRPEFVHYIYLLAPLSLCFLNPAAFALIEYHKQRFAQLTLAVSDASDPSAASAPTPTASQATGSRAATPRRGSTGLRICASVLKGLATNPIVLFTGFGLAANFVFRHSLPLVIRQFVDVLGQSFSASALFYLGLSIVGKLGADLRRLLLVCCSLIVVKLAVFPFITMEYTKLLNCGADTNSTADYAMFGYLFGTIPTAPTVFVFATHYAVLPDLVATGMVLCTLASAPLMFVSSVMVSMRFFTFDYLAILRKASFDVAVLSAICSPWVIIAFLLTRRRQHVLHKLSIGLAGCQILVATGVLINLGDTESTVASSSGRWAPALAVAVTCTSSSWGGIASFVLYAYGLHGSRIVSALIAVAVATISRRNHTIHLNSGTRLPAASAGHQNLRRHGCHGCHGLIIIAILTPLAAVSLTLLATLGIDGADVGNCSDEWLDYLELGVQTAVLLMSIAIALICLVLKHRWDASAIRDQTAEQRPRVQSLSATDPSETMLTAMMQPIHRSSCDATAGSGMLVEPFAPACAEPGSSSSVPDASLALTPLSQSLLLTSQSPRTDVYSEVELDSFSEEDEGKEECLLLLPVRGASQPSPTEDEHLDVSHICLTSGEQSRRVVRLPLADGAATAAHAPDESESTGCNGSGKYGIQLSSVGRHSALLVLQLLVMSSSFFVSLLKMTNLDMVTSGVYIEIVFMDAILTVGQGFLTFVLFGLDLEIVLRPLWKRIIGACRWMRRTLSSCRSYVRARGRYNSNGR